MRVGRSSLAFLACVFAVAGTAPVPHAHATPPVAPIFIHKAQLSGHGDPFGQAGAQFGAAVAVSGDTAVVGAPTEPSPAGTTVGAAYVFVRSGSTWKAQQKLIASDGAAGDYFGVAVSISGDTVVVGAVFDDTAGGPDAGSAYVFVRSGTTWSEQQKLTAADGFAGDQFGFSVSVSGDTAVVGALFNDTPLPNGGAAYVFARSGPNWTEQQKLLEPNGAPGDWFGSSVAVSGDTLVAGAYGHDTGGEANAGAAYVFVRSGDTWTGQQELTASDAAAADSFGYTVSMSGDTVLVASVGDDTAAGPDAGSAYVFVRSGTTWTEQQKLVPSDGAPDDIFAFAVSVSADTAALGAPLADGAPGGDAGAAYVFVRSGSVWTEQRRVVASDGAADDRFGLAVAVDGELLAVGTPVDDAPLPDAGSTYVFESSGTVWTEEQKLAAFDEAAADDFGFSASVSGDTAVVGAPRDDTGAGVDAGAAYVFVRSATGWAEQQKLFASDGAAGDGFGISVSLRGDTLVVGAHRDDTAAGGQDAGSAYVFVRSGTTWTEQQALRAPDGQALAQFGYAVALAGETAVVGAFLDDSPAGTDAGAAYVFVRSGTAWTAQQKLVASDGGPGDYFGDAVAVSADTVVAGAFLHDAPGGPDAGSAYVFVRSGTTWTEQAELLAPDGSAGDQFADSVALSGNTAVVGSHMDDLPARDAGSAHVFVRSGSAWAHQQKLRAWDATVGAQFGYSVSLAGDLLVAGALLDDTPAGMNAGSAYVFLRSGAIWSRNAKLLAPDGQAGDLFGYPVSVSGPTVLVGAYRDDTATGPDAGSAHVYHRAVGR